MPSFAAPSASSPQDTTALQKLLAAIRSNARHETEKGRLFERLVTDYLSHEPRFRNLYAQVQPYADFAAEQGAALGLTPNDKGIDLVATTHGGEHHAVQCKCYAPEHTIAKADIDSFMAASGHRAFSERLLVDTSRKPLGSNAEQMLLHQSIPAIRINLDALEASAIDWTRYTLPNAATTPTDIFLKPRNQPRPHQQKAIADVLAGLAQHERGQLIMACGSGKTFTALRIAEAHSHPEGHILFLVPSLALLSQALSEWTQQTALSLTAFAVCSDSEVGAGSARSDAEQNDRFRLSLHELAYPATTHAATLAKQHAARRRPASMTVVFSTYHSIETIERAQKEHGLPAFDLAICDEAHRTTGQTWEGDEETHFVRIHDPKGIAAHKRLYMTATPRIYSDDAKQKTARALIASAAAAQTPPTPHLPKLNPTDDAPINGSAPRTTTTSPIRAASALRLYSMDDQATYGPRLHTLSFSSAVEQELLVPYKVIVLAIHEEDISSRIQALLTDENNSLRLDDAAKIIGCFKALAKDGLRDLSDDSEPMRRAVAFCQIIDRERNLNTRKGTKVAAKQIADMFQQVVAEYQRTASPEERAHGGHALSLRCEADYVHGGMGAAEKTQKLAWLKAPVSNESRILTNVRCLSEGVDVPALDAVLFLSPRNSQVEVVQAVGRVMRRAPGKKRGYIILPVVIPHGLAAHRALNDNKTYRVVWQVLRALKAHDDEFDRFVNRFELLGSDPTKIEVIDTRELRPSRRSTPPSPPPPTGGSGTSTIGVSPPPEEPSPPEQLEFEVGALERAIRPKLVEKLADRDHWEQWASDIARIAQLQIARIHAILDESQPPDSPPTSSSQVKRLFESFSAQLHRHINAAISREEIIEMLAQHLITRPVFDALFGSDHFTRNNPISQALQTVTDQLLKDAALDKERQALDSFYADVRRRSSDIPDPAARQKLIITLYDTFFASAFPRVVQKHGIVYTPLEVVDFILHSTADLLRSHFGKTLSSPEVHILDPFTGTGTFIARLLASPELIPDDALPRVYSAQLHATEILLLPYYIAAVNIESTYAQRIAQQLSPAMTRANEPAPKEGDYVPFSGILLADTFNIPTFEPEDWIEAQAQDALAANDARRRRQMQSKITVILGNPPYSIGQKSQNDNNQNVAYPALDQRIAQTYASASTASSKKSLRDSYIRALRWASDRIDAKTGGIIGFVTNAGWLDGAAASGLRHCLSKEFSHLYIFNLRGDQRTQGEQSRKEGGKIFGSGSRAPIAISLLVKEPKHAPTQPGEIHYCDIGDYLSREQKLQKLAELKSTAGLHEADLWQPLTPDENNDWLNQRSDGFAQFVPLGDRENKNKPGNKGLFENFTLGVATGRDAWCSNPSQATLRDNIKRLVAFYEKQRAEFNRQNPELNTKMRQQEVAKFINTDPTKISWSSSLIAHIVRDKLISFNPKSAIPALYRPFEKGWLYYERRLNERVYQMPQIFPLPVGAEEANADGFLFDSPSTQTGTHENRLICVSGMGAKAFSVLMMDRVPDLQVLFNGQCFPLYLYSADGTRRSGIQGSSLLKFQAQYPAHAEAITKEAIFYYTYGVLHSPQYRETFANNLLKELPRIPIVESYEDFSQLEKLGRALADLHIAYETVPLYKGVSIEIHKKGCTCLDDLSDTDFHVEKMRYGVYKNPETGKKEKDLSVIHYNPHITVTNIPLAAYDYVVNGRPAIDWVVERQGVRTDKASGIVSDSNRYAIETLGNPRYPLELILRLITVSLKTQELIKSLPALNL